MQLIRQKEKSSAFNNKNVINVVINNNSKKRKSKKHNNKSRGYIENNMASFYSPSDILRHQLVDTRPPQIDRPSVAEPNYIRNPFEANLINEGNPIPQVDLNDVETEHIYPQEETSPSAEENPMNTKKVGRPKKYSTKEEKEEAQRNQRKERYQGRESAFLYASRISEELLKKSNEEEAAAKEKNSQRSQSVSGYHMIGRNKI